MGKHKTNDKPKKKHHRIKKLMKLAVVAGAAYGVKKYLDSKKGFSKKPLR